MASCTSDKRRRVGARSRAGEGYQSLVVSSPLLTVGGSYKLYSGGTESGTAVDGLYTGGQYTLGTLVQTFTLAGVTNRITVP